MAETDKGTLGEKLTANFFDAHFSSLFSFPNPKTKANVEIADVLVWYKHTVLLVEVKTYDNAKGSINHRSSSHFLG